MKLLIQGDRIAAIATDAYEGPMEFIQVSDDFDITRLSEYRIVDGQPVIPVQVPQEVTMRQARLALLQVGLLDNVDAALAAIPDETQRKAAQIEWEYASTIQRHSPLLQNLFTQLGLTEEQLDNLFQLAATL